MNKIKNISTPTSPSDLDGASNLAELAFEAHDFETTKLLFAVAPLVEQSGLNAKLLELASKQGTEIEPASLDQTKPEKLLSYLISKTGKGKALSITRLDTIFPAERLRIWQALNFHRDAILKLPLVLVLWVSHETLQEIAAAAPDLWSRRTGIFTFGRPSVPALLEKLFASSPIPRETWSGKQALAEHLECILAKEAQLRQCRRLSSEVAVARAKEAQIALIEASTKLLEAASGERRIELALWLWNLAHVDAVLRDFVAELSSDERRTFEAMYLDRNELLLGLAENMPNLLRRYITKIKKSIGTRKSVSILKLYIDVADFKLQKVTDQLSELRRQNTGWDEVIENSPRSISSEVDAKELEQWLCNQTKTRPRYLNKLEGDVLRALYSGKPVLEEANRFGATEKDMLEFVDNLESKIRLFLGSSSRPRRLS